MAKTYAGRGCPMVVTGRNEKELQSLVAECNSSYSNFNVHYICGDCSVEEDCKKIVEFMIEKCKRIDIMVLGAGVSAHVKFSDLPSVEIMKKMMDINFFGYVNMTKYALPHLRKAKG
jgi:dehydrogenase/reductase SDR family member 7B